MCLKDCDGGIMTWDATDSSTSPCARTAEIETWMARLYAPPRRFIILTEGKCEVTMEDIA